MTFALGACSPSSSEIGAEETAAAADVAPPVQSAWTVEETVMIDEWRRLNEQCRGGSGDDPATMAACDQREAATARLKAAGICYGKEGQAGYQMTMHRCDGQSL